ncbi:unnamed protein product [Brassicogethes aeneus]|uniref:SAM domain-containing protein n=1 Tax=Brassicogethes aeneus TaxID=1431903 RepID=A0A9P0BAN8_BRAAE|nr:unnamed protein product [Brassicogethes aeneus]
MTWKELLVEWNLEKYISNFEEEEIDENSFFLLENSSLEKIIPKIGPRLFFLNKIKNHQNKVNQVNIKNLNSECQDDTSASTSGSEGFTVLATYDAPFVNRQTSFVGLENFLKPIEFPDFDLKNLLEVTPLGNTILQYYKKNNLLDNSKKTLLVDIIMKRLFDFYLKHRLTHENYNLITSKIITLFPRECASTYYVPAISKRHSISNRPIIAKGRLVDKCRNLLRISTEEKDPEEDSTDKTNEFNDEVNNDKVWLFTRHSPWDEVIQKWKNTFCLRRNVEYKNISTFLEDWPILNIATADELIPGDINQTLEEIKNKHLQWNQTVQPYVIVEGPSIKDITAAYVVVDKIQYKFTSVQKAIDVCFKVFHVFHGNYPVQSEHIWLLIQKVVYAVDTPYDKIIPFVMDLIENLKQ